MYDKCTEYIKSMLTKANSLKVLKLLPVTSASSNFHTLPNVQWFPYSPPA